MLLYLDPQYSENGYKIYIPLKKKVQSLNISMRSSSYRKLQEKVACNPTVRSKWIIYKIIFLRPLENQPQKVTQSSEIQRMTLLSLETTCCLKYKEQWKNFYSFSGRKIYEKVIKCRRIRDTYFWSTLNFLWIKILALDVDCDKNLFFNAQRND